jgi:cell wall-associated NlpC family hydrolase
VTLAPVRPLLAVSVALIVSVCFLGFIGINYFFSYHEQEPFNYDILRNGDVIFIMGRTLNSSFLSFAHSVRDATDSGDVFSHVGIVRKSGDLPYVIHASPEARAMKFEPAGDFLSRSAGRVGVYRAKDGFAETASLEALRYYEQGREFDSLFDMSDDYKVYCTELIWLVYKKAGVDLLGSRDSLYDSALYGKVILPMDLRRSENLVMALEITFERMKERFAR